jgi:ribosome biogenesis GTPase
MTRHGKSKETDRVTADRTEIPALVVAAYGQRGKLETADGDKIPFQIKGRNLRTVCGDRVNWSRQAPGQPVIVTDFISRNNALERYAPGRGQVEILAANLDLILVVLAAVPEPDWYLIDRYLCSAQVMGCDAGLIYNKTDLAPEPASSQIYRDLGYPFINTAASQSSGLEPLRDWIKDKTAIFVGQSGVGKSSLLNILAPGTAAAVGELSASTDEGRHTTTASVMHSIESGGRLIDTPGVREFIPAIRDIRLVQTGFREIVARADNCRFANCQHLREPDCAVKQAVQDGTINALRYESYRRLLRNVIAESGA